MENVFNLEKQYYDEIIDHARAEAPNECCGILAGSEGKVVKLYRTTNAEHSPFRYNIEPSELISIYEEMGEKGWDMLGIYHSHTHADAYPSPIDIKYAYFPDSLYLVVSLKDLLQAVIRGFHIKEGKITEIELRIKET